MSYSGWRRKLVFRLCPDLFHLLKDLANFYWYNKMNYEEYYTNTSSRSTGALPEYFTGEEFLEQMRKMKEVAEKILKPITIYIWKGLGYTQREGTYPELIGSDLVDINTGYLMAGVGIVAGWKAYDFLKNSGVVLQWSERYIELEDQEVYHLLKEWIKIKKEGQEDSYG